MRYIAIFASVWLAFSASAARGNVAPVSSPAKNGEETLQALYDLTEFAAVPAENFRAHYYFSSYTGSDSNAGDELHPLRSFEKAAAVCLSNTRCTFAAGEVWSQSLITDFTVQADPDPTDGDLPAPLVGETVTYDVAPDTTVKKIHVGSATAGNWCVDYGGIDSILLDYDATAAQVEKALERIPGINDVEVRGGGESYSPWIISFVDPKTRLAAFSVEDTAGSCGGGATGLKGDTATLTESLATARIIDYDPVKEIIALRILEGRHQLADDDDRITGLTSGAVFDIDAGGVTDTLAPGGGAASFLRPACDDDDQLCILLEGNFEDPPIIDCGIFRTPGRVSGAHLAAAGGGNGWVGVQNFIMEDCAADVMSASNMAKVAYLNVEARKVRNVLGGNQSNNGITNHDKGSVVAINPIVSGMTDSENGVGAPVALTSNSSHGSKTTIIGQGTLELDASESSFGNVNGAPVFVLTGGDATLVGSTISAIPNADSSTHAAIEFGSPVATKDSTGNFCRVIAESTGGNALRAGGGTSATVLVNAWELTLAGVNGICLNRTGDDTGSGFIGRGVAVQDVSRYVIRDLSQADDFFVDIQGTYPDGTAANWALINGRKDTLADARADAGALNARWDLFTTNSQEMDKDSSWEVTGAGPTRPGAASQSGCGAGTCPPIEPYSCPLAQPIPAFVLGGEITELTLDPSTTGGGGCAAPCNVEVIVDDADGAPGVTATGSWRPSRGADPYDGGSSYNMLAGNIFQFETAIEGPYEVSEWWTGTPSRCDAVPVDIFDGATFLETVIVDQRSNGGQWNSLGSFDFHGTARVVLNSHRRCSTNADAVRFVPIQCSGPDLVVVGVDYTPSDPEPGEEVALAVTVENQGCAAAGEFYIGWFEDRGSPPGLAEDGDRAAWGTSLAAGATRTLNGTWSFDGAGTYSSYALVSLESQSEENEANNVFGPVPISVSTSQPPPPVDLIVDDADGAPAATATGSWNPSRGADPYDGGSSYSMLAGNTFQFETAIEGPYEVSQWWTSIRGRCAAVSVDIFDGAALLETVIVNQASDGGQWNSLGSYDFNGTARVVVNSQRGCSTSADAVRFSPAP